MALTGGRGEDIRTLKRSDVVLDGETPYILLRHYKGKKNVEEVRMFPLANADTLAFFTEHADGKKHNELMFPKYAGVAWDDTSLSKAVARVRNSKAGLTLAEKYDWSEKIVMYHLRHGVIRVHE